MTVTILGGGQSIQEIDRFLFVQRKTFCDSPQLILLLKLSPRSQGAKNLSESGFPIRQVFIVKSEER